MFKESYLLLSGQRADDVFDGALSPLTFRQRCHVEHLGGRDGLSVQFRFIAAGERGLRSGCHT